MTTYSLVTDEDRKKYAPELVGHGHIIVKDERKLWVVKHKPGSIDEEKRDFLAYLLGRNFANVAEVKLLNPEDHQQIKVLANKGENSFPSNTFLVRLGGSYSLEELPCKTLEQAVATELVYSTWIRRRDTHTRNKVYLDGIPIFFDHQTAFLGDHGLENIDFFFSSTGEGHAGSWRVKKTSGVITTRNARQQNVDHHHVHDIEVFKEQLKIAKSLFKQSLQEGWEDLISQAGFTDPKRSEIVNFLKRNLETIDNDLKTMEGIIFRE